MVLIILLSLIWTIGILLFIRNNQVYKFRTQIISEDFEESIRRLNEGNYEAVDNYSKLPSYNSMVLSFKSLTKENWLPKK